MNAPNIGHIPKYQQHSGYISIGFYHKLVNGDSLKVFLKKCCKSVCN